MCYTDFENLKEENPLTAESVLFQTLRVTTQPRSSCEFLVNLTFTDMFSRQKIVLYINQRGFSIEIDPVPLMDFELNTWRGYSILTNNGSKNAAKMLKFCI